MGDAAGSAAKLLFEAEKAQALVKSQALHSQLLFNLASGRNADNQRLVSQIADSTVSDKTVIEPSQRFKTNLFKQWVTYASPSVTIRDIQGEWEDFRTGLGENLPKYKCGDTDSMFARIDLGYYPIDPQTMVHREEPIVFPDPVLLSDYKSEIRDSYGTDAVRFFPTIQNLLVKGQSRGLSRTQMVELLMQFVGTYFQEYAAAIGNISDETEKVEALLGLMSYSSMKSRVMAGLIKMERKPEHDITSVSSRLRSAIAELLELDCMEMSKDKLDKTIDAEASILFRHFMLPATHQQLKEYTRARLRHDNVKIGYKTKVEIVSELESRHASLRPTETLSLRRADFTMSLYFSQVAGEVQTDLGDDGPGYGPEAYEGEYNLDPESLCFNTGYETEHGDPESPACVITEDGHELFQHDGKVVLFFNGEYCYATESDIANSKVVHHSPAVPSAPTYQPRYVAAPSRGRGGNGYRMAGRPLPSIPSSSGSYGRNPRDYRHSSGKPTGGRGGGMRSDSQSSNQTSGNIATQGSRYYGRGSSDASQSRHDTGLPVPATGPSRFRPSSGGHIGGMSQRQPVGASQDGDWTLRLPVANIDRPQKTNRKTAKTNGKNIHPRLKPRLTGKKKDRPVTVQPEVCKRCGKRCRRDTFNSCPIYGLIKLSAVPCSNCLLAKITAYHNTDMCHSSTSEAAMFYEESEDHDQPESDTEEDSGEESLN